MSAGSRASPSTFAQRTAEIAFEQADADAGAPAAQRKLGDSVGPRQATAADGDQPARRYSKEQARSTTTVHAAPPIPLCDAACAVGDCRPEDIDTDDGGEMAFKLRGVVDAILADLVPALSRRLADQCARLLGPAASDGSPRAASRGVANLTSVEMQPVLSGEGGGVRFSRFPLERDRRTVKSLERSMAASLLQTRGFSNGPLPGSLRVPRSRPKHSLQPPSQQRRRRHSAGGTASSAMPQEDCQNANNAPCDTFQSVGCFSQNSSKRGWQSESEAESRRRVFSKGSTSSDGLALPMTSPEFMTVGLAEVDSPSNRSNPSRSYMVHSDDGREAMRLQVEPPPLVPGQTNDDDNSPMFSEDSSKRSSSSVGPPDRLEQRTHSNLIQRKVSPGTMQAAPLTVSQVMHERVRNLAREASFASGSVAGFHRSSSRRLSQTLSSLDEPPRSVPAVLVVLGVVPQSVSRYPRMSKLYQIVVRGLLLVACVAFPTHLFLHEWQEGHTFDVLSMLPLAVGAFVGLGTMGFSRHADLINETFDLLSAVARERGFYEWYQRHMFLPGAAYVVLWMCSVATCIPDTLDGVLHSVAFGVFSGVILSLSFVMLYVCRALMALIDNFCCETLDRLPVSDISHNWNLTQAVVRRSSEAIEHCLLALCLVVAVSMPLALVSIVVSADMHGNGEQAARSLLPCFFVGCGVLYVVFAAATISERCARVPALINAACFGPGTERARQHVVDYIISSAAGFYVFGMRVTVAMVLKFAYGWTIVGIGVVTRIMSTEV